jgi:hypothetical protein
MKRNFHLEEIIEYIVNNFKVIEEDVVANSSSDTKAISQVITDGPKRAKCPVCDQPVQIKDMNSHLDSFCKSHIYKVESIRKPAQAYSMLKETQLRQLLQKDSIASHGDKKTLIKRHQYWTDLYNANVDAIVPKSMRELKKELIEWEKSLKNVGEVVEGHLEKYKDEYTELLEQVRQRKKIKLEGVVQVDVQETIVGTSKNTAKDNVQGTDPSDIGKITATVPDKPSEILEELNTKSIAPNSIVIPISSDEETF